MNSNLPPSAIEKDARLLEQVAEALRAGPGTSVWAEALNAVGGGTGGIGGDAKVEAELLAKVRRHLQAGKSWREIQAGPDFTRKLMAGINASDTRPPGLSVTGWVAFLGVTVLVGLGLWALLVAIRPHVESDLESARTRPTPAPDSAPEVLAFSSPRVVWDFGSPWPGRTKIVGGLPLSTTGEGLRPKLGKVGNTRTGAAALLEVPLPPDEPVVIEVTWDMPPVERISAGLVAQLFLTDNPALEPLAGLSESEWLWQVDRTGARVVTATSQVAQLPTLTRQPDGRVTLRLSLQGPRATLTTAGQTVWTGPLSLNEKSPRYVGIRYLANADITGPLPTIKLLRILGER